jgi:lambda family phage tail tape measure protein
MANGNVRYRVDIDTKGATQQLDRLRGSLAAVTTAFAGAFAGTQVVKLASTFQDLRTSLQLLYKDARLGSEVFEDIKNFAATSIFSVEDLTETIIKLKAAGLTPTVSQLQLFADVSTIAADSVGALQAITDLYARTTAGGLGLEDLNRLADRGIPVFTILSERLGLGRLELSKFGQTAEGAQLILKALEQGLSETFSGASAARAGNVSQAFSNLGDAIANAADAVGQAGLNEALTNATRSIITFIEQNQALIKAIGEGLGRAVQFTVDNFKQLAIAAGAFLAVLTVSAVLKMVQAFALFNSVLGKNPLLKIAVTIATAIGAYKGVELAVENVTEKFKDLTKETDNVDKGFKVLEQGSTGKAVGNLREQVAGLNEEAKKQSNELAKIGREYRRNLDLQIQAVDQEREFLSLSTDRQRVVTEIAQIENDTKTALIELTDKFNSLDKKARGERLGDYIKERQAIIENGEAAKRDLESRITNTQKLLNLLKDTQNAYTAYYDARRREFELLANQEIELAGLSQRIELENKLTQITQIREALMRSLGDISEEERENAIRAIMAATTNVDTLKGSFEDIRQEIISVIQQYSELGLISKETAEQIIQNNRRATEGITMGAEKLTETQQKLEEQRRSWSYGWKRAITEYIDDITNGAKQAERIFRRFTQSMEDAIVDFAKTGKFNFRSFLNSILEDLLRSQVRQLIGQIFNAGGGGRTGSSIGKLLGFANGGIIPTNSPVLVGERGPEIISGAAGRVVTPNNQIGSTSVTYNINAVDAMSFKQMLAQDPSFLYAVTQQGARSVPQTRR